MDEKYAEIPSTSGQKPGSEIKKISRREFLKIAGVTLTGGWLALRRWIDENGPASLLSSFLTRDLNRDTPPEFINENEDPNPFFENPDQLLKRSFQLYKQLKEKDPSQYPPLIFSKRKNYISTEDVLRRYKELSIEEIADTQGIDILGERFVIALKSLSPTDPEKGVDQSMGGDILNFSAGGIDNIDIFLQLDPGSGFINRAIKRIFNTDRDTFYANHPLEKGFSEDEAQKIQTSVVSDLADAVDYFKTEQDKSSEPLDFAKALVYFYTINQGDIYAGLWDSVVFFKLLVRNNLDTLQANSTHEQSMLLGKMFKDPFSPRNSLNWLATQYQLKDIGRTHPLAGVGFLESQQFKDFMIVNRSGGIYHGLNILTWAAVCMDPLLVEAVTAAYYSGSKGIGMDFVSEHGPLKIESDLIVAMRSPEVRQIVDAYVKVE